MPFHLFAGCGDAEGAFHVRRVRLAQAVQNALQARFAAQEHAFLAEVTEEVAFEGNWKPDDEELLTVEATAEANAMVAAVAANLLAIPAIDGPGFAAEGIVALFAASEIEGRILVQNFSSRQILDGGGPLALIYDGDTFKRLSDPVFALGTHLVAIIENSLIKFKSYSNARRVFDIAAFFTEATDEDITAFTQHANIQVADAEVFRGACDQTARRLVHAVASRGTLDQHAPDVIVERAALVGLPIAVNEDGRIVLPTNRRALKILLRFLDDGLYRAPLSGTDYIANSKRPVPIA